MSIGFGWYIPVVYNLFMITGETELTQVLYGSHKYKDLFCCLSRWWRDAQSPMEKEDMVCIPRITKVTSIQ